MKAESTFLPKAYFKGGIVPFEDAKLSVATRSLQYGTAAFGGMRVEIDQDTSEAIMFRLEDHVRRLAESARLLLFDLRIEVIESALYDFVRANKPDKSFYIRPFIYDGGLQAVPHLESTEKDFLVYGLYLGDVYAGNGVRCCISSWQRQSDSSIPLRGKISGSYATSALAKSEALARGYDEAILMNSQGKVSEGTGMNLFIVRNGVLITPSIDQDILEGITRRSVIEIATGMGIKVIERPVDKSELFIADEVFLTGTAARIASVASIENYVLPEFHQITDTLAAKYLEIVKGQSKEYASWLTRIRLD